MLQVLPMRSLPKIKPRFRDPSSCILFLILQYERHSSINEILLFYAHSISSILVCRTVSQLARVLFKFDLL